MKHIKQITILFTCLLMWAMVSMVSMVQAAPLPPDPGEDAPVTVKVVNTSQQPITVHVLSMEMVMDTTPLEPGKELELKVPFGHNLKLEYPSSPYKSVLSAVGSLNETDRTVMITDDGDHVFIQEKFSGQRIKGEGQKRAKRAAISEPAQEQNRPDNQGPKDANQGSTVNADPNQPQGAGFGPPRPLKKEDPNKPAPKEKGTTKTDVKDKKRK